MTAPLGGADDGEQYAFCGSRCRTKQLSSFLGLLPSEDSSGEQRRQGAITKAGFKHARRLLVEAAWHYRHRPSVSQQLARRQQGCDPTAGVVGGWSLALGGPRRFETQQPWQHCPA